MAKYISKDGLLYFKQKLVNLFATKTELNSKQNVIDNDHKLSSSLVSGLSSVATSGSYNDLSNKPTIPTVPTALSSFTNDVGFITNTVNNLTNYYKTSETYTKSEVDSAIAAAKTGRFVVVSTLPTASAETMNAIYLVPSSSQTTGNVKDEYITIESSGSYSWEMIGSTSVDLSGYWSKTELTETTNAEIDTMFE